jgi:heme a synthase
MTDRTLKRLSIVATLGMFVVLVMGATVTSTGSGEGCGQSWPLCNGQFIPEFAVASLIEYSHRLVTGIEGLLIAALAIGVWRAKRSRLEIRLLVPVMVGFLLLQAGLGAAAVMWPQDKAVLALHFGISLVAFASVFLTAVFLHQTGDRDSLRDRPVPTWFRRVVWGSIVYVYFVVYLGAYIRHTKTSLACFDWPLCNGYLFPGFSGPTGIAFAHRLAALGSVILVVIIFMWARRLRSERPDLYLGSTFALGLILLQTLSGAIIVFTRLNLFSALAHAAIMTVLFASLSYLVFQVVPRPRSVASHSNTRSKVPRARSSVLR